MEIKNNEKLTETLVINKVPSKKIFNQMVESEDIVARELVKQNAIDSCFILSDNEPNKI